MSIAYPTRGQPLAEVVLWFRPNPTSGTYDVEGVACSLIHSSAWVSRPPALWVLQEGDFCRRATREIVEGRFIR